MCVRITSLCRLIAEPSSEQSVFVGTAIVQLGKVRQAMLWVGLTDTSKTAYRLGLPNEIGRLRFAER